MTKCLPLSLFVPGFGIVYKAATKQGKTSGVVNVTFFHTCIPNKAELGSKSKRYNSLSSSESCLV